MSCCVLKDKLTTKENHNIACNSDDEDSDGEEGYLETHKDYLLFSNSGKSLGKGCRSWNSRFDSLPRCIELNLAFNISMHLGDGDVIELKGCLGAFGAILT